MVCSLISPDLVQEHHLFLSISWCIDDGGEFTDATPDALTGEGPAQSHPPRFPVQLSCWLRVHFVLRLFE